jgi:hypothetical protein
VVSARGGCCVCLELALREKIVGACGVAHAVAADDTRYLFVVGVDWPMVLLRPNALCV